MKKRGFGQIAVLSSVAGLAAPAGLSMYAACKSALKGSIRISKPFIGDFWSTARVADGLIFREGKGNGVLRVAHVLELIPVIVIPGIGGSLSPA